MRLDQTARADFRGEDGSALEVTYSNRGEPYRQGVELSLEDEGGRYLGRVFLDECEGRRLRDMLCKLYTQPADR